MSLKLKCDYVSLSGNGGLKSYLVCSGLYEHHALAYGCMSVSTVANILAYTDLQVTALDHDHDEGLRQLEQQIAALRSQLSDQEAAAATASQRALDVD